MYDDESKKNHRLQIELNELKVNKTEILPEFFSDDDEDLNNYRVSTGDISNYEEVKIQLPDKDFLSLIQLWNDS